MPWIYYENDIPKGYASGKISDPGWVEVLDNHEDIAAAQSYRPPTKSWGAFRVAILDDKTAVGQSFQSAIALFMSANPIKTSTLMTEASKDVPYVAYLVDTWNDLVDAAEYVPGAGIIDDWNGVAVLNNVPLQWLPNGKLASQ